MTNSYVFESVVSIFVTVGVGFWGWIALKVIDQGRKLADLEARIILRERECVSRYASLALIHEKINRVAVDTAEIRGRLGVGREEDRGGPHD